MTRLGLVCLLLLHTKYASGDCPDTETNVFRICQNHSSHFTGKSGGLYVSPDDVVQLLSCKCSIEGNTTNIFNLMRNKFDNANPFNYTIHNGTQFLRYDEHTKILDFPSFNKKKVTLALERKRNSSERNENHRICFDFQVNKKESVTINCKASLKEEDPAPKDKPASLGVILGSAFTVFILLDVAIFGGIYYLVKRRILNTSRLQSRVSITSDKKDRPCRRGTTSNSYVGITPSNEYEPAEVTGEYETQQPNTLRPPRPLLPEKKTKTWLQFNRSPKVKFSVTQRQQPDNEYEDYSQDTKDKVKTQKPTSSVESFQQDSYENLSQLHDQPQKTRKNQSGAQNASPRQVPKVALKSGAKKVLKPVTKDDWVPADEYEEVEVPRVPREQYTKNPKGYAKMHNPVKPVQGPTDSPGTRPTENYEKMESAVASPINRLNKQTQPGSNVKTGSPNQKRSAKVNMSTGPSPTTGKPDQGSVVPSAKPTEMYDNMAMHQTPKARVPSDRTANRQAPPKRQRTMTEVNCPTQTYDNYDPIAEMRRVARAESVRKEKSPTDWRCQ
ncbi:uncharacterized protein [Haliotis cracherodii]|uniref:uncharacterized protein n=1 Tax=Haliotis cracherodii TaxID=6455 RepID=UPI0039E95FFA